MKPPTFLKGFPAARGRRTPARPKENFRQPYRGLTLGTKFRRGGKLLFSKSSQRNLSVSSYQARGAEQIRPEGDLLPGQLGGLTEHFRIWDRLRSYSVFGGSDSLNWGAPTPHWGLSPLVWGLPPPKPLGFGGFHLLSPPVFVAPTP